MLDRFAPYSLSLLRIVAGFTFFLHGPQKLFGYPPSPAPRRSYSPCWGRLPRWRSLAACCSSWGFSRDQWPSSCPG